MPRTTFALLLALLLLAPLPGAAAGGLFSASFGVPAGRVGDQYLYDVDLDVSPAPDQRGNGWQGAPVTEGRSQLLLGVEGRSRGFDRFGVEQPTWTFLVQQAQEDALVHKEQCHMLDGGATALRRDVEVSMPESTWRTSAGTVSVAGREVYGEEMRKDWTPIVDFDTNPCWGWNPWAGAALAEGDTVPTWSLTVAPGLWPYTAWAHSAPAVATAFHGREALALTYDAAALYPWQEDVGGHVTFVLAEGLPAVARVEADVAWTEDGVRHEVVLRSELVGYTAGEGDVVPVPGRAAPPAAGPQATFVGFQPRALDDSAFGFPYPFEEAFAALRADPQVGLADWLDAHPDAVLMTAIYERRMQDPAAGSALPSQPKETDGGWLLIFGDGQASHGSLTVRTTGARTAVGVVASPMKVVQNVRLSGYDTHALPESFPAKVLSSASFAALLEREGVRVDRLESFCYFFGSDEQGGARVTAFAAEVPYMFGVGDGEDDAGRFASAELVVGGLWDVSTSERRTTPGGLVGGATRLSSSEGRSALAALAGPSLGAGLAAAGAAATGLALLFVLLKFLVVPLFTRLKRDALLDNPVRARLYERVRGDPGIHLADLVDFAGIGYGATRHHLEHLAKARLLTVLDVDGYKRYYASGEVPPALARQAAVLRHETNRRVYDLLVAEPGLSLREAGRRLELSAPTVHRIKKRLEKEGLLPAAEPTLVASA